MRHTLPFQLLLLALGLLLPLSSCTGRAVEASPAWTFVPDSSGLLLTPFEAEGSLYAPFVDTSSDPPRVLLYALDPASGALRWATALDHPLQAGEAYAPGLLVDGGRLIYHGARAVHALDAASGAALWSHPAATALLGSFHGRVALIDLQDRLVLLDGSSGRQLARADLLMTGGYGFSMGWNILFVHDGTRLAAFELASGQQQWDYSPPDGLGPPELACDGLVIIKDARGTHALDAATGKERWALPLAIGIDACAGTLVYDQGFDGLREIVRVYDTAAYTKTRTITPQAMRRELDLPEPAPDHGDILTPEGVRIRVEPTERTRERLWDVLRGATASTVLESRLTAIDDASGGAIWVSPQLRGAPEPPIVAAGMAIVAAQTLVASQPQLMAFALR